MKRTETQETIRVAQWLKRRKILFCHVPNEGARGKREASILSMMGTRRGVPDLLIFETAPVEPDFEYCGTCGGVDRSCVRCGGSVFPAGIAIEMKRVGGDHPTPAQERWLEELGKCGWLTKVCYGADEAIAWLEEIFG